ncbi:hypothetical protein D9611_008310 [Ephemerocybe angulata]|uniref:Uncharacterized protein n=1 Tax=Ephemerocybe angulata TaxID=980116 RepID=A0A8H5BJC4_9AGAR|nr:hypothetical protein D9611_008310 [Tulosesus angulatus]
MNSSVNCSLNNRNREVYLSIRELSENLRSGARTTMQGAVQTLRYPMRTGIEQQPAANASDRHGILPCTTSLRSCLRPLQLDATTSRNVPPLLLPAVSAHAHEQPLNLDSGTIGEVVLAADSHRGWKKALASSSSPATSTSELAAVCNQREDVGFRSPTPCEPCPKAETGELDACRHSRLSLFKLQPRPAISPPSTTCDSRLLSHASDPGHASKPASVIELSSLFFLYASDLRAQRPALHQPPSLLQLLYSSDHPPVQTALEDKISDMRKHHTTSSLSPPTARLGDLPPTLMHRFPPTPLNV